MGIIVDQIPLPELEIAIGIAIDVQNKKAINVNKRTLGVGVIIDKLI